MRMEVYEDELPGTAYWVPDSWWGFEAVGRTDHPGLCANCCATSNTATLLKGTGARPGKYHSRTTFMVTKEDLPGLLKDTLFALAPRDFRIKKVALLHGDRVIGRATPDLLSQIQRRLEALFPGGRK